MSPASLFTLRLVGIGILFMPAFSHLLSNFLPSPFADCLTAIICVTIALFVDDLLFEENHGYRLKKAIQKLLK